MASICTTALCSDGRAMVGRMRSTFNHLQATSPLFQAAHFEATVLSIEASLEAADSWYAAWIPFNPVCCTLEEIGKQADVVTNQMLEYVGAASVPVLPQPADPLKLILVAVGVVVAVFLIIEFQTARKLLT